MSANSDLVQSYMGGLEDALGSPEAAFRALAGTVSKQALVMTFNDMFFLLALGILAIAPLVLLLRPLPRGVKLSNAH